MLYIDMVDNKFSLVNIIFPPQVRSQNPTDDFTVIDLQNLRSVHASDHHIDPQSRQVHKE
jgi:hypothetical protein